MNAPRLMHASDRWFRILRRLYPPDFRDEMGDALVETYHDRAHHALTRGGLFALAAVWVRALVDSLRNGPGERARPAVSWRRGGNWGRDAERALRRLLRAPAFALVTIGTLTIGLGMVAIVYTVVQRVLIDPMPYRQSEDLYYVWRDYGPITDLTRGALSGTDIVEFQKPGAVIEDVAAFAPFLGGIFSLREGADPSEIAVTVTSPNLFEMLGVQPFLGRTFARDEVGRGRPNQLVLTYELWNRFGADPAMVGSQVRLNGQSYTVIGILPVDFSFVRNDAVGSPARIDAFQTFATDLSADRSAQGGYSALIRARHGASPQAVADAVDSVGRLVNRRDFNGRGLKIYAVGLKADLLAKARPALIVLGASGALLALMLMVNLASVLLARATQREREFAVSRALGASSGAVARATLVEGAWLGLIGGIVGTFVAAWGTRALVALAPLDLPRRQDIAVDWRIGAVMTALGLLLGLLAALMPAVWGTRVSLSSLLASSAVRGGGGHGRMRRGTIVVQVALSLVLLSSGGLVVRSFERLLRADLGFRPDGVLTFRVRTPPEFFPTAADIVGFQDRIERALASIPGVSGASATSALPLTASAGQLPIFIPGAPGNTGDPERDAALVDLIGTRASYMQVMGMRLVAGRLFDPVRREGLQEAMIDRRLASRFFPTGDPLGARIPFRPTAVSPTYASVPSQGLTIVGIVEPARQYGVQQEERPQLYIRTEDWGFRPLSFVVRTARDPQALLPDVQAAVRRVDTRVAVGEPRTMAQIVGDTRRQQQTSAVLIAAFALGALLLAAMGLFGVVSSSVTRRRHELAVRLALGADHRRVLRLVIGEGAWLVCLGVLIGLPGIYAAGRVIRGLLIETSPADPLTLAIVSLGLVVVTMVACYLPARRVVTIDPVQSLRQE